MEIIPQVSLDDINIKDTVFYYTINKNPSDRELRFVMELYGIEKSTAKPVNVVTVYFSPAFKDSHLSIANLAIHTLTGAKYSKSLRRLTYTKIRIWRMGE